ncbi:response regulator transcription factor [Enterovirga sp. CN4-39]|uniref:response regulator transcription factor n=1 Tax=Enterovirga sp. CN4-39 TaxID=3400910 RepID=UPI003C0117B4
MMTRRAMIAVIDDDESVRESLPDLISLFGHNAETFSSAEDFLASDLLDKAECLVLDVAMPGMSGIELQRELVHRGRAIPVVFITAHGDEQTCARLRRPGNTECLLKPFTDTALLDALETVLMPK